MVPYSPPLLEFKSNQTLTTTSLTATLAQQVITNLSQSTMDTNDISSLDNNDHDSLLRYKILYRNYHGIISTVVCVFGLTCNLFNIIVLTRPLMRSSTNVILTSLAISDLIKMLFVLPAAILFYCLQVTEHKSEPDFSSQFQVTFYMIQMLVALTLHCISIWLTVLLAAFRYVFLTCRTLASYVSSVDRALLGVGTVVFVSTILCIPSYIQHRIVESVSNDSYSLANQANLVRYYRFEETNLSKAFSLRDTVFVLHSVIFKLIPCILLLLFSFLLILQLRKALAKAKKLEKHEKLTSHVISNGRARGRRHEKENRRTTLMLVIVCVLFLITELPQGAILLLTFLSKTRSKYYYQIYQQLGDTFDILALINNSVNFILYCCMSGAFRDTFKQTFCFLCMKLTRNDSNASFKQLGLKKQYPLRQMSTSMVCDPVSIQKGSVELATNAVLVENNDKPRLSTENYQHSTRAPLLNKRTSSSSQ